MANFTYCEYVGYKDDTSLSRTVRSGTQTVGTSMTKILHPGPQTMGSEAAGCQKQHHIMNSLKYYYDYSDSFIRGHLLNAKLGGKAVDDNLFLITKAANNHHKTYVEEPIKEKLDDKDFKAPITYTVNVIGGLKTETVACKFVCTAMYLDSSGHPCYVQNRKKEDINNLEIESKPTEKGSKGPIKFVSDAPPDFWRSLT